MGKKEILITCPRCGGQKIIDDLTLGDNNEDIISLSDILEGKEWRIERMTKDFMSFCFTCLECGYGFTKDVKKIKYTSKKDIPKD